MNNLSSYIDLTLLKVSASETDIKNLIKNAINTNCYSVCINPYYVKFAKKYIAKNYPQSNLKICSVVGFPLGSIPLKLKKQEAIQAVKDGADEIDMVINVGAFKSKKYTYVLKEINAICSVSPIVKVIIETSEYTNDEIITLCNIFNQSDALFIKTSTGFSSSGAKIEDVKLIKEHLNPNKLIKASGGIKSREFALDLINAGANRIGTSSAHLWL